MTVSLTKNVLLVGLVLTLPCFVFLLFCSGFLPVGAMAILAVRSPVLRDPAALVLLVPLVLEAALYLFLLNKLAGRLARSIHRDATRATAATLLFLMASLAVSVLPIHSFDCMDGHVASRCSAVWMYFGWLPETDVDEPYFPPKCGDFGW